MSLDLQPSTPFSYRTPVSIDSSSEQVYRAFSRQFNINEGELRKSILSLVNNKVLILKQNVNPLNNLSTEEMTLMSLLTNRIKGLIYGVPLNILKQSKADPIYHFIFNKNYEPYAPGLLQADLASFINDELNLSTTVNNSDFDLKSLDETLKANSSALIIVAPGDNIENFRILQLVILNKSTIQKK